jgi:3-deoxy-D-manno-octulosonic-acid transferase
MSGICLIGGSFATRGGHTPFEPAAFGCALIHGPSTHNFAEQFAALDQGGAAIGLAQIVDLEGALRDLDGEAQARLARAAPPCLARFETGALQIMARLLALLPTG